MVARTLTVAFDGIEARRVEVQCALSPGIPNFTIVGLPDKAVCEARERVRAALASMQIALPSKKLTLNLSPANLPKAGSHFDLPIALAILAATGIIPPESATKSLSLGELAFDGSLIGVSGALPAALKAAELECNLLCPDACGAEAAWVGATSVYAAKTLSDLIRHLKGDMSLPEALPGETKRADHQKCLRDVKGQEKAKRALEIAAAGQHHLFMVGTPGSGKSMLATRLPSILPLLSPTEALETSIIHSVSGLLDDDGISRERPFRQPHHTASMAAIVGGGRTAKPGEISLAHNGVLFMDEFPEFPRTVLETLRQPVESGEIMVARAHAHVHYPAQFMLIAAANPCRCGYVTDPNRSCPSPSCSKDYLDRISGPLMDRFDLRFEVPPAQYKDLSLPASGDSSAQVAQRVAQARAVQLERYEGTGLRTNAQIEGQILEDAASPDSEGRELLTKAAETLGLSARGYHRVMKVARTIADLGQSEDVRKPHIAEALSYRVVSDVSN